MPAHSKWTPELLVKCREMRAAGESCEAMATALGITGNSIRKKLRREGIFADARTVKRRWKPETIDRLKALWDTDMLSEQIGEKLGVTARAVRSQARTLGLRKRPVGGSHGRRLNANQRAFGGRAAAPTKPTQPSFVKFTEEVPESQPVDIMGLTDTTCRWPLLGDRYCGAHTNGTYCAGHHKLAYVPSRPKMPGEMRRRA